MGFDFSKITFLMIKKKSLERCWDIISWFILNTLEREIVSTSRKIFKFTLEKQNYIGQIDYIINIRSISKWVQDKQGLREDLLLKNLIISTEILASLIG